MFEYPTPPTLSKKKGKKTKMSLGAFLGDQPAQSAPRGTQPAAKRVASAWGSAPAPPLPGDAVQPVHGSVTTAEKGGVDSWGAGPPAAQATADVPTAEKPEETRTVEKPDTPEQQRAGQQTGAAQRDATREKQEGATKGQAEERSHNTQKVNQWSELFAVAFQPGDLTEKDGLTSAKQATRKPDKKRNPKQATFEPLPLTELVERVPKFKAAMRNPKPRELQALMKRFLGMCDGRFTVSTEKQTSFVDGEVVLEKTCLVTREF
jgi:hypothetical protein